MNTAAVYPRTPTARNMYPSWLTVEYASTRLMSGCMIATVPAASAVNPPTHATTVNASGAASRNGCARHRRNTPAVTIVAAWISADTGVGPSIASGSQRCNGNCALLPTAASRSRSAIAVAVPSEMNSAPPLIAA